MNPKDRPDEFGDVGERLRGACTPTTQLRLDELKVRIQRQAQRTRQKRGLFMRRRSVATVLSILGLAITGIGALVLAGQGPEGPSVGVDAARHQYQPGGARSEGAPGRFCMAQGARPGTRAFRECVRLAAAARSRAHNGNKRGGNPNARRADAPGRYCQANGAHPGSRAFRECVTLAAEAQRAARGRS